jgi:hypothetical protein
MIFYISKLHPLATNLDLGIGSAHERETSICIIPNSISGAVYISSAAWIARACTPGQPIWILDKPRCSLFSVI